MEMLPLDNQYNFRGNIIPDEWYVRFTNGRGSPDLPLISILSEIVYWYRPKEIRDPLTGEISMVTRVKKNMKNKLMSLIDKVLLLKRALIESVFSKIKLLGKFEHSRHRSVTNAFVHMVAALISYELSDNKPSIKSLLRLLASGILGCFNPL